MKYSVLLLLLASCTATTKYKVGDCLENKTTPGFIAAINNRSIFQDDNRYLVSFSYVLYSGDYSEYYLNENGFKKVPCKGEK